MTEYKTILTTLVGSRAHGLETPTSDTDTRGVFVAKTSNILKLGGSPDQTRWSEGSIDDTAYELGKFLHMATKSNATILEVLHGPTIETTEVGEELKALFPYMWTSRGVMEAFKGYSRNQLTKFMDEKDNRPFKFSVAMLRVLLLGVELLRYGTITVNVKDQEKILQDCKLPWTGSSATDNSSYLKLVKKELVGKGEIIDVYESLKLKLKSAYEANPDHTNDIGRINEFLLKVRKDNW